MLEIKNINKQKSSFNFEGFALAEIKSHTGTFKNWDAKLTIENKKITGIIAKADSKTIDTGIEKLDNHLKSEDFFYSDKYQEIKFKSISVTNDSVTGDLTINGITSRITFSAEIKKDSLSADFRINMKPFNIKYLGIKKEVRVFFNLAM